MTPTDQQVAELRERLVRVEALLRQLQGALAALTVRVETLEGP